MSFADFTNNLQGQKMFQILAEAKSLESKGAHVIHLEIGDPDFDSPIEAKNAIKRSIDQNNTHYVQSSGLPEFKDASRYLTYKSRGFLPTNEQILVTSGANIQIYLAIACIINPGDEVIIPDPSFVSYSSIILACRGKPIFIKLEESEDFKINPLSIQSAITERTKAIIINSPHNPTGAVLDEERIRSIYEICDKNDIYLLSDEVYGRMIYSDSKAGFNSPSKYDHCSKRTVLIHSLSKTFAMTGWRIGAVTGPENLIKKMSLLFETITSCVPPFIQEAAIDVMKKSSKYSYKMIKEYEIRRNLLVSGLNQIPGFQCKKPEGTFYLFANIKDINPYSEELSKELIQEIHIATCPGIYFGKSGEGYIRFCFANSIENIELAIYRIKDYFS